MIVTSALLACCLLYVLYVQTRWANNFVELYQASHELPEPENPPHVGVIMSLRGADPYLEDSLRGLMALQYPSYEVRIIVDSAADPAWNVVHRICDKFAAENVTVEALEITQDSSSLKNAALIQGVRGCSDRCEAFAWLDSDTVPGPNWLSHLARPLENPEVGAACGIRWYAPPTPTLANYVRHIWNAAAVLQMIEFGVGWGGAFIIRKSLLKQMQLEKKWCHSLVEDTLASSEVLQHGKQMAFVAGCTMPNPENTTLSWCVRFITRQLQGLRYYHSAWEPVVQFGLISGGVLTANAAACIVAAFTHDLVSLTISAAALVVFAAVALYLMRRSEKRVNKFLQDRAVGGLSNPLGLMLAAPAAQIVHLIALVRAYMLRSVSWRGIRYRIRSGFEIHRTNYKPYVPETDVVGHSL